MQHPTRGRLMFVCGWPLYVIRDDLLEPFEKFGLLDHLVLGSVCDESGKPIPRFHSFYARHCVGMRGESGSAVIRHPVCGHPYYKRVGFGYIVDREWPQAPIAESIGLMVTEETVERLKTLRLSTHRFYEIKVETRARDGLPRIRWPIPEGSVE